MKATILAHSTLPENHEEVHRFKFELDDGARAAPLREVISLRTARVIVSHLEDGNALIQMLRAMVVAAPADYEALVGRVFQDAFLDDGPSDRISTGTGFQNASVDAGAEK